MIVAPSTAIVRPDLAGHVRVSNDDVNQFVAHRILPCIAVKKRFDNYYKVGADAMYELPDTLIGRDGGFKRTQFALSTGNYLCKAHGLEGFINAADRNEYSVAFELDSFEAMRVANMVRRRYEYDVAAAIINETNFPVSGTTGVTLGTPWSTVASATPAQDVAGGILALYNKTGVPAKMLSLLLPYKSAVQYLPFVTDFKNRMFAGIQPQPGQVTEQVLANYFGVGEVILAGAQYNTAITGQSASLSGLWNTDYAFLFMKMPGNAGSRLEVGGLGATFCWDVYNQFGQGESVGLNEVPLSISMYSTPNPKGDAVQVEMWRDPVLTASEYGYLIKNIE